VTRSSLLLALFCLALLVLAAGCSLLPQRLETRAAQYYNYMAGHAPQTDYSSFLSPAYRRMFKREDLKKLNAAMGVSKQANTRYPKAGAEDIAIVLKQQFAFSVVRPELGDAFASQAPVRWVKTGNRWYLYTGSDAEVKRYGPFPGELGPPEPPKPLERETQSAARPGAGAAGAK
jgi:hypothetical protein